MTIAKEIVEFYDAGREAGRLFEGLGRIEFARMQELMQRYLPPAPAVVADVGGGPGTYACWLATKGYAIHLSDPVPLHVQQAREAVAWVRRSLEGSERIAEDTKRMKKVVAMDLSELCKRQCRN